MLDLLDLLKSSGFSVISSVTVDFPHDGKLSEFPVDHYHFRALEIMEGSQVPSEHLQPSGRSLESANSSADVDCGRHISETHTTRRTAYIGSPYLQAGHVQ